MRLIQIKGYWIKIIYYMSSSDEERPSFAQFHQQTSLFDSEPHP